MIFLWHFLFNSFQLYRSRRLNKGSQEWKDIFKATTSGAAIFILIGHVFRIGVFTPLFMVFFWFSSTILTVLFRRVLRYALNRVRLHGRNLRSILIVGTNRRAYDFAHMIEEKRELGYRVIGYVDNNIYLSNGGIRLLGTMESFPVIIRNHVIDEVVVTLPVKSCYEKIQKIIQQAEEQGITIRYLSDLFGTKIARLKGEMVEDFSLMTMNCGPQDGWQHLAKQITDIILASTLILLTLPLMLFVAVAIKLTSPGPVFFLQKRVGQNKRQFRLCKFRTMMIGAENMQSELEDRNEMDGPVFKMKNDPRVTKIGRLLRKTSIDELPQLFNVFKGDMSLVGPRPLPVRDYNGFNKDWQLRRFSILPGITCTWQINGRNDTAFEKWMKMDMEYIDNWNLSSDFKILIKTIPAVLRRNGAA
jgi:exopolysaccharide biosynthesis polyprenyl glycosylphosphotransferase